MIINVYLVHREVKTKILTVLKLTRRPYCISSSCDTYIYFEVNESFFCLGSFAPTR